MSSKQDVYGIYDSFVLSVPCHSHVAPYEISSISFISVHLQSTNYIDDR